MGIRYVLGASGSIAGPLGVGGAAVRPLLTSLISYWSLDEVSAGVAPVTRSDSHGTNHLTDNGTTPSVACVVGNGCDFTPANGESLNRASNDSLNTGDIDFTFCAWAAPDATNAFRDIVNKASGVVAEACYFININSATQKFRLGVHAPITAALTVAPSLTALTLGAWYFVAGWHDAVNNTLNIQVNNGNIDSVSYSAGCNVSTAPFAIGARGDGGARVWDGKIDEVGYWKRVLTPAERTWLYNGGSGRSYAAIAAYSG